jgi:hypothetical protein
MRSLFVPLRLATDARGLEFITDLDPAIDEVACAALREYQSAKGDVIGQLLQDAKDDDGVVVGDETRLRQIITNLARCVFFLKKSKAFCSSYTDSPHRTICVVMLASLQPQVESS